MNESSNQREQTAVDRSRRRMLLGSLGLGSATLVSVLTGCKGQKPMRQPDAPAPTVAAAAPPPLPTGEGTVAPKAAPPTAIPEKPPLPDGKDPRNFILHGENPLTLETRREAFGTSVLTATSHLFVRQNLPLPDASYVADRAGWSVEFAGVASPQALSVGALQQLGLTTVAMVLQCSGNGRKYYTHGPSGSPWGVGAAGCVVFSGVPLRAVVDHLGGVEPGAKYLTTTGGEQLPEGVSRDDVIVERSIPLDKALDDCLLAWEMNGEPLPLSHGGPLRLVVPGYFGCNQIKFVKRVAFSPDQTTAKMQRSGYRMRPIGEAGSPDQPSMWAMPVKSFITLPSTRVPVTAGKVRVTGVAFGGMEEVRKVEVSSDGERFLAATFIGPDMGRYAFRMFTAEVPCEPGVVTIYSRATTKSGKQQPELREENERGYGNDSWRDMGIALHICAAGDEACLSARHYENSDRPLQPRGPITLSEAGKRGRSVFREHANPTCGTCHALMEAETTGAIGPRLDDLGRSFNQIKSAVKNGVGVMPAFGPTLSETQLEDVAQYVFEVMHGT